MDLIFCKLKKLTFACCGQTFKSIFYSVTWCNFYEAKNDRKARVCIGKILVCFEDLCAWEAVHACASAHWLEAATAGFRPTSMAGGGDPNLEQTAGLRGGFGEVAAPRPRVHTKRAWAGWPPPGLADEVEFPPVGIIRWRGRARSVGDWWRY